ncbi:MAG TPA: RNA methyltransferase [Firmicutes bacterium]|nr:RNA methyltransferase [Bacillota bacterium]
MRFIQSRRNPLVRSMRALHNNKVRRSRRRFLVEGVRLLEEALASECIVDTVLYCIETTIDGRMQALLNRLQDSGVSVIAATQAVVDSVSETESPPGLTAVVRCPPTPELTAVVGSTDLLVLGDQIQDPGNAGTIIRTAEAAGAGGTFFSAGSVYPFSDKVIRASMGSLFRLPVEVLSDGGQELCNLCINSGWQLVFAVPDEGVPWWNVDFKRPTLLVLGNEGSGISGDVLALKGSKVSIPLAPQVESLNVAIAGAVLLFETVRQRTSCKEKSIML